MYMYWLATHFRKSCNVTMLDHYLWQVLHWETLLLVAECQSWLNLTEWVNVIVRVKIVCEGLTLISAKQQILQHTLQHRVITLLSLTLFFPHSSINSHSDTLRIKSCKNTQHIFSIRKLNIVVLIGIINNNVHSALCINLWVCMWAILEAYDCWNCELPLV